MLATLVPLFDENLMVKAYSCFTQKKNYFLSPESQGTGIFDGVGQIAGLEVIQTMGIETLSDRAEVFVPVNNISILADLESQCDAPHGRLVLLMDNTVTPTEMYVKRLKELKKEGYKLAIRKLSVHNFEEYKTILSLLDYVILDHKRIDISKARIYFTKLYPNISLCAGNIQTMEIFQRLKWEGGYQLYEGEFYRVPVSNSDQEIAPLRVNYIQLLNTVNNSDFELTQAADIISKDTALVISLLKMVNRMARNSEITSIRHAAAMLGQRELKRWINTAVANELYADKPSEVTRLSLLRARFAENLAPMFNLRAQSSELFLMGLFSVLDVILEKTMEEALQIVQVSKEIKEALISNEGKFGPVLDFMSNYENANWQEVSRQMVLLDLSMDSVYQAYMGALQWYRELMMGE